PTAASLDPQARAELLWAAVATANEVYDDAAALAASQRLAPLLGGIEDPYLQATCQLVIAWTSPITGDFDGALRQALSSLAALRAQDEPYWTGVAALSAGSLEITLGHLDDGLRHLQEARDVAERLGYSWLAAWSRVLLGTLNVMEGRLDQARELLDQALELSLVMYVTGNVSLCLISYAQLALAAGDPERAALLAGAAEGLRRRASLGAWPMLRQAEAALLDQVRQALSTDRFEQGYEAGTRLSQREAGAAARGRGARSQRPRAPPEATGRGTGWRRVAGRAGSRARWPVRVTGSRARWPVRVTGSRELARPRRPAGGGAPGEWWPRLRLPRKRPV